MLPWGRFIDLGVTPFCTVSRDREMLISRVKLCHIPQVAELIKEGAKSIMMLSNRNNVSLYHVVPFTVIDLSLLIGFCK